MHPLKLLCGLALTSLSATAAAWPFSNSVPNWSIQFYAPKDACAHNLQYDWGDFSFFNDLGRSHPVVCRMVGNIGGITWKMPTERLNVSWDDSNGIHYQHSLDMDALTQGATVYGGAMELRLVQGQVELWVAEPKVPKETRPGYSLWQPFRLHSSTQTLATKK